MSSLQLRPVAHGLEPPQVFADHRRRLRHVGDAVFAGARWAVGCAARRIGIAQRAGEQSGVCADLNPLAARKPHFAPKAKAVIFLFCYGGPSQVDLFDPKPALEKWHGKPIPVFEKDAAFFSDTKNTAFKSPYNSPSTARRASTSRRSFRSWRVCRRFVRDPLDALRIEQSCAGAVSDEHRLPAAGAAEFWLVGHVWPGGGNRSAAGVCRDVGSSRRADRRGAELELGLFAAGVSRHAVSQRAAIRSSI